MEVKIPWFMIDISNKQLITSPNIPISDIGDVKEVVLTETPIPGLNYSPISPGGSGNRKISFTLPLIKRNNNVGNILMLKQFENLRNNATGLFGVFTDQFHSNPKVLYYWGLGGVPLVYYVKKCDPTHKQGWTNAFGFPQYSEINIELWLDETNPLYLAEEVFRKVASLIGMGLGVYDVYRNITKPERRIY